MRPVVAILDRAVTAAACAVILTLNVPAARAAGEFDLIVWPATLQISDNAGNAFRWNTTFTGIALRLEYASPFGFTLTTASGSEQLPAGAPAGTGGTDTIWGADVTYRWQTEAVTVHAFLGYGAFSQVTTNPAIGFSQFTSAGYRVGADISAQLGGNWTFNAEVFWQPGNSVTLVTSSGTAFSSAPAIGWQVSVATTLGGWRVETGWRAFSLGTGAPSASPCPCTAEGAGWFIGFGKTF